MKEVSTSNCNVKLFTKATLHAPEPEARVSMLRIITMLFKLYNSIYASFHKCSNRIYAHPNNGIHKVTVRCAIISAKYINFEKVRQTISEQHLRNYRKLFLTAHKIRSICRYLVPLLVI